MLSDEERAAKLDALMLEADANRSRVWIGETLAPHVRLLEELPAAGEPDALGLSESELEALNLSIGELRRRIIALRDRLSRDAAR